MPDPEKYRPKFNYSGWEAAGSKRPKPGASLDTDFANIARSIDETIDALKDIRRSDGKLVNGLVDMDAMEPGLKADFQGYKDDAETARDQAQQARNAAQNAQDAAAEARDQATNAAQEATNAAQEATDTVADTAKKTANLSDLSDLKEARSNLGTFSTVAEVQSRHITPVLDSIRTNGYYAPGDGMGGTYIRVDNEPAHWGKVQSADGQWWGKASRPAGTFALEDFLHPQDLASARQGDIDSQDEGRVTAAIQSFHDRVIDWWGGAARRSVTVAWPKGTLAINDEIFSEYFAEALWSMRSDAGNFHISVDDTTFWCKNWLARAAVRDSGLYKAIGATYPVPKAVFRWELPNASGLTPRMSGGQWTIRGGWNVNTDPIGVKMTSGTATVMSTVRINTFQNTQFFIENIFNSSFHDLALQGGGYQPTEYGGVGFLPAAVRFSSSGKVVTATEPVFEPAHAGRWFGLARAGLPGHFNRRNVFFATISSVDSPTQITLTDTPVADVSDSTGTFIAVRGSMAAGSNVLTLSCSISADLTGRYISVVGAGIDGKKPEYGLLTAVVVAHSGDALTLSANARHAVTDAPLVVSPQMFIGATAEALEHDPSLGTTDDVTFTNLQVETASWRDASVPLVWANTSSFHLADGSKVHGAGDGRNNFGANFCGVVMDDVRNGYYNGILTHSGYSPIFGHVVVTGKRIAADIKGNLVEYPSSDKRSIFYLAPSDTLPEVRIYLTLARATADGPDQRLYRLGPNGSPDMIVGGASTRIPESGALNDGQVPPERFVKVEAREIDVDPDGAGLSGLGAITPPTVNDADAAIKPGIYKTSGSSLNVPAAWGVLEVLSFSGSAKIQRFVRTAGGIPGMEWVRVLSGGSWTPWMSIQPILSGSTKASGGQVGICHFDTTLGKPVWWDGSKWVDATGAAV